MTKVRKRYTDPEVVYKRSIALSMAQEKAMKVIEKKKKPKKKTKSKDKGISKVGPAHHKWKDNSKKKYSEEQLENLEKSKGMKKVFEILEANRLKEKNDLDFEEKKKLISII